MKCCSLSLSSFRFSETSLFLICSEEKCKKSQEFAAEVGLPALSNVLLPKTRGFSVCLEALHNSLDAGMVHEILMKIFVYVSFSIVVYLASFSENT